MKEKEQIDMERILTTIGLSHESLTGSHRISSSAKASRNQPALHDLSSGEDLRIDSYNFSNNQQPESQMESQAAAQAANQVRAPTSPEWTWDSIDAQEPLGTSYFPADAAPTAQSFPSNADLSPGSFNEPLLEKCVPPSEGNGDSDGVEELVEQLSDRMGSLQIGADGQM